MTDPINGMEKQFIKVYLSGLSVKDVCMLTEDYVLFYVDTCYMSPKTYHDYMKWMHKLEKECPLLKELR